MQAIVLQTLVDLGLDIRISPTPTGFSAYMHIPGGARAVRETITFDDNPEPIEPDN